MDDKVTGLPPFPNMFHNTDPSLKILSYSEDFVNKVMSNPEALGVFTYKQFEFHMLNLEHMLREVTRDQETGMFIFPTTGKVSQELTTATTMYFDALSQVFACNNDFVEGYNLIEAWCFFYDFGRKFIKGNIVNTNLPKDHPFYMPDLSSYYKFYKYLCLAKAVYLSFPKELKSHFKDKIFITIPKGLFDDKTVPSDLVSLGAESTDENPKANIILSDTKE